MRQLRLGEAGRAAQLRVLRERRQFCENGAKATFWELTSDRVETGIFADHTVTTLLGWSDHALEAEGRLTRPMRYHAATDTYVVVSRAIIAPLTLSSSMTTGQGRGPGSDRGHIAAIDIEQGAGDIGGGG